jgi:DNA-binding MarR family transcriptional regulator
MADKYAFVPLSVTKDHRLTLIQSRVLIALYSFVNHKRPDSNIYPKRGTIAARCGYSEQTVSRATTELEKLGWLVKANNSGGCSRGAVYFIREPSHLVKQETVSEPDTVLEQETVSEPARVFSGRMSQQDIEARELVFAEVMEKYPFRKNHHKKDKEEGFFAFVDACKGKSAVEVAAYGGEIIKAAQAQREKIGDTMNLFLMTPLNVYIRGSHKDIHPDDVTGYQSG